MLIHFALDFDGTYTLNPPAWQAFIRAVMASGQTVAIVTMRDVDELAAVYFAVADLGIHVFATERKAKKAFMRQHGHEVNVWIDDNPDWLYEDAAPRDLEKNSAAGLWSDEA